MRAAPGIALWVLPDGTPSEVCPRRLVTPDSVEWLRWHDLLRVGVLPRSGGLLDQAQAYVDSMLYLNEIRANERTR